MCIDGFCPTVLFLSSFIAIQLIGKRLKAGRIAAESHKSGLYQHYTGALNKALICLCKYHKPSNICTGLN